MIQKTRIYESSCFDPYRNLAVEKQLMDTTEPGECTLYLWQNQNTVVIGQNQNPWVECRTSLLEQEGGKLARRLSGGGAVFHDLGNLNFTFCMHREAYDVDRQLEVIRQACALVGIHAEKSGRNDLLTEGRKFSGNAFYHNATHAYHHGTLLICANMEKLQRYLSPSKAKLEAKGIQSVRSRVVNLSELTPDLTVEKMKQAMTQAFTQVYGTVPRQAVFTPQDLLQIEALQAHYGSWEYLYGKPLPFQFSCESRFSWGHIQFQLQAKNGVIEAARVYSDAMDWQLPAQLEAALTGCRFTQPDMLAALQEAITQPEIREDLCKLLSEQQI